MGSNGGGEWWRVRGREWWTVRGEGVVGSDGGRGSNGGGRELWREGELTWACHCPCPFTFVHGRLHLCMFVFIHGQSHLFVGGSIHLCAFTFICR